MANYFSSNLRILVGKLETTPGSMETLSESDFDVRVWNPEVSITSEVDNEASKYARGDHAEDEAIPGIQHGEISFSIKVHWAGDNTTEPAWYKFLKACGAYEYAYSGTGYAVWPMKRSDAKSMTIWIYDIQRGTASPKATIYKFKGCMGNCVITSEGIGMPWMANLTFQGALYDISTNQSSIPDINSIDTQCPDKLLSNTFTIDSTSQLISSFSLDFGNDVQPVYDQSDSVGIAYYGIVARAPRFTANPLMNNDFDTYNYIFDGTNCPDVFPISLTGNHHNIYVPNAQMLPSGISNREGLVNWDLSMRCLANGTEGTEVDSDMSAECTWELRIGSRT